MPFYKQQDGELMTAPNFVFGPGFTLREETQADNTYPVDGWYWFADLNEAMIGMQTAVVAETITPFQAKAQLLRMGYLPAVKEAIAAADEETQLAWDEAVGFDRDSGVLNNLAAAFGWGTEDVDAFFAAAKLIRV